MKTTILVAEDNESLFIRYQEIITEDESFELVGSVDSALGFFDIKNGTMDEENGYTYPNEFIMATFVFEITGAFIRSSF